MWDLRTLAQFQGNDMSPRLSQHFMVFVPVLLKEIRTRGVSPSLHLVIFLLVKIRRIKKQRETEILLCNSSDGRLLLRPS